MRYGRRESEGKSTFCRIVQKYMTPLARGYAIGRLWLENSCSNKIGSIHWHHKLCIKIRNEYGNHEPLSFIICRNSNPGQNQTEACIYKYKYRYKYIYIYIYIYIHTYMILSMLPPPRNHEIQKHFTKMPKHGIPRLEYTCKCLTS